MAEQRPETGEKQCESQRFAEFANGGTIMTITGQSGEVGVIRRGRAHITCLDHEGRESTIELLNEGDCFGAYFLKPLATQEYVVIADTLCKVMFINYSNVLHSCRFNCKNHAELVKDLLRLTAGKAQSLSLHVNVLSQRSLREKLLTYLGYRREATGRNTVELPISLVALADYLCVDRSAMMREIRHMNEDGVIRSEGRYFTLL